MDFQLTTHPGGENKCRSDVSRRSAAKTEAEIPIHRGRPFSRTTRSYSLFTRTGTVPARRDAPASRNKPNPQYRRHLPRLTISQLCKTNPIPQGQLPTAKNAQNKPNSVPPPSCRPPQPPIESEAEIRLWRIAQNEPNHPITGLNTKY